MHNQNYYMICLLQPLFLLHQTILEKQEWYYYFKKRKHLYCAVGVDDFPFKFLCACPCISFFRIQLQTEGKIGSLFYCKGRIQIILPIVHIFAANRHTKKQMLFCKEISMLFFFAIFTSHP
jgi:hypothetical protein